MQTFFCGGVLTTAVLLWGHTSFQFGFKYRSCHVSVTVFDTFERKHGIMGTYEICVVKLIVSVKMIFYLEGNYIMLKIEKTSVMNFENAIRGARNPQNSWNKSDSYYDTDGDFVIGEKDLILAHKLCEAGTDHRKFVRQIFVSADITAPLYWWKEFDTYKVATVSNSTSTMHRIHSSEFLVSQFSCDQMTDLTKVKLEELIRYLENLRVKYNETKDKRYWYDIIQLLPSSYNQLRTCTLNYETLINIYHARRDHKLIEWHTFCEWISTLPYAMELITF